MDETVTFFPEGLLHKFGFGDGDLLYEVTEDHGLDVPRDDLLILVVTHLVLPRLDQRVTTYTLSSMHNPIRALTVDGVEADLDTELTPEEVEVPVADILTVARVLARPSRGRVPGLADLTDLLAVVGVHGLLDVLDAARGDDDGHAALGAVRGAVALAAGVLATDPAQLPAQLVGRLRSTRDPVVAELVAEADGWRARPWLRPLTTSLTPPGGRLVVVRRAHPDETTSVAVSPDGHRVATGSFYRDIRVTDLRRGTEVGHAVGAPPGPSHPEGAGGDAVVSLAFGADALLAASADRCVYRLDPLTGHSARVVAGETDNLYAVAVAGGGGIAVAAPRDIWGVSDDALEVWDAADGRRRQSLAGASRMTAAVAVSGDGTVAVGAGKDGALVWWDLPAGRVLSREQGVAASCLALSEDGSVLAVGRADGTVAVRRRADVDPAEATFARRAAPVRGLAFVGPDRLAVGAADGTVLVGDLGGRRLVAELPTQGAAVGALAGSGDGRWLATGSADGTVRVWDLQRRPGGSARAARTHEGAVAEVAVSQDGAVAVTRGADGSVLHWHVGTGVATTLPGQADAVLSALAGATPVSPDLRAEVEALDLRESPEDPGEKHAVTDVAVSADGRRALSSSTHWTTIFWRLGIAREESQVRLWDLRRRSQRRVLAEVARDLVHGGHVAAFRCVTVDRAGSLGAAGADDGTVRLWDLGSGELLAGFTGESAVVSCALSADGRLLVAGEAGGRVHLLRVER